MCAPAELRPFRPGELLDVGGADHQGRAELLGEGAQARLQRTIGPELADCGLGPDDHRRTRSRGVTRQPRETVEGCRIRIGRRAVHGPDARLDHGHSQRGHARNRPHGERAGGVNAHDRRGRRAERTRIATPADALREGNAPRRHQERDPVLARRAGGLED